ASIVLRSIGIGGVRNAQQDGEPFLVVGLAAALVGKVEVVKDLAGAIEGGPRRFLDHVHHYIAAGLPRWARARQTFAQLQFHGSYNSSSARSNASMSGY